MTVETYSLEPKKRMLALIPEGISVAEFACRHQSGHTTFRCWKSEELDTGGRHPMMRPAGRESSVLNVRMRCSRRTRPFWKRPRPGCQPMGTVVAGAAEELSVHAKPSMHFQTHSRKDPCGDRDVQGVRRLQPILASGVRQPRSGACTRGLGG